MATCIFPAKRVAALTAAAIIVASHPVFPQQPDRRDVVPRIDVAPAAAAGVAARAGPRASGVPQTLVRHVEGLDSEPRPFDEGDVERQLGDPFGKLIAAARDPRPGTLAEVLRLIDSLGTDAGGLVNQMVFIVSESGQITVAEAPQLKRRARAVIVRQNAAARDAVFVAPSMRADGRGVIEVMGWDPHKALFNYYERAFDPSEIPVWIWKGDSSHAWNAQTRDGACFRCHRNGEPVMKELRQPWQNWHSPNATIKPESIPDDSPLKTDPLFSIVPESAFLKPADVFENVVKGWIGTLNRARIARYKAGELSVRNLLEPLFRTTTVNWQPSLDVSAGVEAVRVPWTFFYNSSALGDAAELICDDSGAFGQTAPLLDRTAYNDALARLNFRLEEPGVYRKQPGDTHFAFLALEPARTDVDLIFNLVKQGVIGRRLAATLLLVDVPNPVYSPMREAMYALVPDWRVGDVGPAGLDVRLPDLFRGLHAAGTIPEPARTGISQFLALWASAPASWEADACRRLEAYLGNVGQRWRGGDHVPYFRLLGARRDRFLSSAHEKLKESELLFPKSDTSPGLVMHDDGTVRP